MENTQSPANAPSFPASAAAPSTAFKNDIHRIGESLGHLATETADAARSGASELRHGARHAVDAAKDKLGTVRDTMAEQLAEAKVKAGEATDSVRGIVTRHPIASVTIAASIGLIAGLIIFRPRS